MNWQKHDIEDKSGEFIAKHVILQNLLKISLHFIFTHVVVKLVLQEQPINECRYELAGHRR